MCFCNYYFNNFNNLIYCSIYFFLVSRNIIESHGGLISVESEYGVGSIFYFELPILESEILSPFRDTIPTINENKSTNTSHSFELTPQNSLFLPVSKFNRVLIVDDSKMNRRFNRRILERYFNFLDEVYFITLFFFFFLHSFIYLKYFFVFSLLG